MAIAGCSPTLWPRAPGSLSRPGPAHATAVFIINARHPASRHIQSTGEKRMMDGSLLLLGLAGPELTLAEAALFRRIQPAGYILLPRNLVSPGQTRKLTDDLRGLSTGLPILAIDHQGGPLSAMHAIAPSLPSAAAMATRGDMGHIADAGALTGQMLIQLGFNLNLAPVLDLDHFPESPGVMAGRTWGRNPQRVIDYAGHWNRWMRKRSMATCAKHFPAGGLSRPDLPCCLATLAELQREDVIPYTALMPELDAIMTAHSDFPHIDPELPASLTPRIVRRFLRDQLGFDRHLVLTDDLDAQAITTRFSRGQDVELAIKAGNDLAMISHRTETAELAARSIAALPRPLTAEARERVDRFRDHKLHPPPPWSDKQWLTSTTALAKLAVDFSPD